MDLEKTSKFSLFILRTQEGKTFTAISRIIKEIEQDEEYGRSIHVVYTMNTLLNNKQFSKRLESVEESYGKSSVIVFASKYNGKYTHVKNETELRGLCLDISTCPRIVIMCNNYVRTEDGFKFLTILDKNRLHICRSFIYIDEIHQYITDRFRSQIEQMNSFETVKGILGLSATPEKVWNSSEFWRELRILKPDRVLELNNIISPNYAGYKDMMFNCIDDYFTEPYKSSNRFDYEHVIGFIKHVFEKYPEIIGENTRTFIPAHIKRKSHEEVREFVFSINQNCIVVVLNGFEKTLKYKDDKGHIKTLPLDSDEEEVCETISRLIIKHNLQNRPLVITGFLCVGMGQTLSHKNIGSFTSAIFGHLDLSNDDIYQLMGRIFGNMKNWDTYIQTQVYCPTTIMHRCCIMEECARQMSEEFDGEFAEKKDYTRPQYEDNDAARAAKENIRKTKEKIIKNKAPEECSNPIIVIENITDEEKALFDKKRDSAKTVFMNTIIQKYNKDAYERYHSYSKHHWNVDNEEKRKKWSIEKMLEKGAISSTTNITSNEKTDNVLMIYLYGNILILQPWSGKKKQNISILSDNEEPVKMTVKKRKLSYQSDEEEVFEKD